jgi:flagellar hook-associated protein 2
MAGISGIGSGVDIDSIVKATVAAERAPKEGQLNRIEKSTTAKFSGLGSLRSAVEDLISTLSGLNTPSAFNKQTVSSTSTSVLTASASKDLIGSHFSMQVQQLATGSKLALQSVSGGYAATFNTGQLTLSAGTSTLNIDVTAGKNTLADIRDAINKQGVASGFSASILTDVSGSRLLINSSKTGDGNDVNVTATENGVLTGNNSLLSQGFTRTQRFELPVLPAGLSSTFKAGTLTIGSGASSFNISVNAGDDISKVRDAINTAGAALGVVASVETSGAGSKLVLTSASETPFTVSSSPASATFSLPALDPLVGDNFRGGVLSLTAGAASLDVNVNDGDTLIAIRDSINLSGGNFTASITTSAGRDSLVIASANGEAIDAQGSDLSAGYPYGVDYLTATQPAANSDLTALTGSYSGSGFAAPNISTGEPGFISRSQSAKFTFEGLQFVKDSNTISDVVDGLTVNLVSAQSADDIAAGKTVDIAINQDKNSVRGSLQKFVDGYNKLIDTTNQLTSVIKVGDDKAPLVGPLLGDTSIRNLLSSMRKELTNLASAAGVRSMAELGITTQKDGKLAVDGTKIDAALTNNYDAVATYLAGSDGLMGRLSTVLKPYGSSGGLFDQRQQGMQTTLRDVGKQRDALELRIAKVQERLYKQFNAMDQLVGQLRKTSESLTSQLANLPGFVRQNN